ncbi:helix-turn-helix transcriptional regulator [Fictibacillus barbaricus]|uniref:DNA-binding XRE family transcriptional regulator n=1 Tax=Fictibacillus barbaricus TaxID=182136 RepID=A0ABU1TVQ7_9BACL|nr:helix-turn-helix domain-containing protein [Fictibacillus barbaricus]MDR7071292.1 DNA-binding XRE family transcriptional regulator [Fictibacillus barbaricus]
MTQIEVINLLTNKIKLVRTELGYTQDKMADILGISKKTLVQIEKERVKASWTVIVALCALFRNSEILYHSLGGDPLDVMEVVVHDYVANPKEKTWGGNVWWKEVISQNGYKLQQNMISKHFRILDENDYRIYSSYDKEEALNRLKEI